MGSNSTLESPAAVLLYLTIQSQNQGHLHFRFHTRTKCNESNDERIPGVVFLVLVFLLRLISIGLLFIFISSCPGEELVPGKPDSFPVPFLSTAFPTTVHLCF